MPLPNKKLVRLAVAMYTDFITRRASGLLVELPVATWNSCTQLVRQIRRAQLRGWQLAAGELQNDLRHTIPSIQYELGAIIQSLPGSDASAGLVTASYIYQDLFALGEEF